MSDFVEIAIVGVFVWVGLAIAYYQRGRRNDRTTTADYPVDRAVATGTDSVSGDAARRSEEIETDVAACGARVPRGTALDIDDTGLVRVVKGRR